MVIRSIYAKNDEFFTFNDDLQTKDVVVFVPLFGEHWKIDCVLNQDANPAFVGMGIMEEPVWTVRICPKGAIEFGDVWNSRLIAKSYVRQKYNVCLEASYPIYLEQVIQATDRGHVQGVAVDGGKGNFRYHNVGS